MNKREMEERITGLGAEVTALYEMREPKALAKEPEPQPTEFITVGDCRYRLTLDDPMAEVARALHEAKISDVHSDRGDAYIHKATSDGCGGAMVTVHLRPK